MKSFLHSISSRSQFHVFVVALSMICLSSHGQNYVYDLSGHMTAVTYTNGTQVKYTYDSTGNISAIATNSIAQDTNSVITIATPVVNKNSTNNAPYTFSFTWSSVPGTDYEVLYSTNLNSDWRLLGDIITATSNTVITSDLITTNRQRFYRVILAPVFHPGVAE